MSILCLEVKGISYLLVKDLRKDICLDTEVEICLHRYRLESQQVFAAGICHIFLQAVFQGSAGRVFRNRVPAAGHKPAVDYREMSLFIESEPLAEH